MSLDAFKEAQSDATDCTLGAATRTQHIAPAVGLSGFVEFSKQDIEQSIQQRFELQVKKFPARVAIKTHAHEFTYMALNENANRIARVVLACLEHKAVPVVLLLEQGAAAIAAILAVLKSGNIYVPLDPAYPRARNRFIFEDSRASLILTNNCNLSLAQELNQHNLPILNLDEIDPNECSDNLSLDMSPDALAVLVYTSGSTGRPKGVMQNHRNILHNCMRQTNLLRIASDDRLTQLYSYSVWGAIRGIFNALLNGAALFPRNVQEEGLVGLATSLTEHQITIYHSVASVFRHFAATLETDAGFSSIRLIILGGERVLTSDLELVRKHLSPHCVLFTGLGSTEAGTVRHLFVTRDTQVAGSVLPLGYAVEDMEIRLLDENGNDVGSDNMGEIAICSRYLFPGYWRQPELTEKVLRPDPKDADKQIFRTGDLGILLPDGLLLHVGRTDSQVKIRGFRVEIAEIELVLLEYGGIDDAIVVIREDRRGEKHLVAYAISRLQPVPTFSEVRFFLAKTLPRHMLPSAIFFTDAFPLTPNGKVDRKSLAGMVFVPSGQETGFVAPHNATEKAIAGIWSKVLGAEQIGIHDDFFDLGGNSLLASQVLSRIKNIFDAELSLPILFNQPTVAALAVAIEAQSSGVRPTPDAISAEREEGVL